MTQVQEKAPKTQRELNKIERLRRIKQKAEELAAPIKKEIQDSRREMKAFAAK